MIDKFHRIQPWPELSDFISAIWVIHAENCADTFNELEILLPEPSSEIVFNYSDPYGKKIINGIRESQIHGLYFTGQNSSGYKIKHGQRIRMIGFKFKPWGFSTLFNLSAKDFEHKSLPLSTVYSDTKRIEEALFEAENDEQRISLFQEFLLSMRRKLPGNEDVIVPKVFRDITQSDNDFKLIKYYKEQGIDARTIERKFLKHIGLTPKQVMRITRFNKLIRHNFSQDSNGNLIDPVSFGYYDASHLSKEFRYFTGESPKKFFQQEHSLLKMFARA